MPGKHNAGCCNCAQPCVRCSGTIPTAFVLRIIGAVDDDCTDCDQYETPLTLTHSTGCTWVLSRACECGTGDANACVTETWTLELLDDSGVFVRVTLVATLEDATEYTTVWESAVVDQGASIDCCGDLLRGLLLDFVSGDSPYCDFSSSEMRIRPVCDGDVECEDCDGVYTLFQVVIAGITGTFTCTTDECSVLNGTFIFQINVSETCEDSVTFDVCTSGGTLRQVTFTFAMTNDRAKFTMSETAGTSVWNAASGYGCVMDNYALTRATSGSSVCNTLAMTCTVTTLI